MFFYDYPTLSYHLKAVFYVIWCFLLCFSEIPFTIDCISLNACHTFRDCDARQSSAAPEGFSSYACHTVWNCYARQTGAIIKGPIVDAGHAVGDCYTRQTGATSESLIANVRYAVRDCNTR